MLWVNHEKREYFHCLSVRPKWLGIENSSTRSVRCDLALLPTSCNQSSVMLAGILQADPKGRTASETDSLRYLRETLYGRWRDSGVTHYTQESKVGRNEELREFTNIGPTLTEYMIQRGTAGYAMDPDAISEQLRSRILGLIVTEFDNELRAYEDAGFRWDLVPPVLLRAAVTNWPAHGLHAIRRELSTAAHPPTDDTLASLDAPAGVATDVPGLAAVRNPELRELLKLCSVTVKVGESIRASQALRAALWNWMQVANQYPEQRLQGSGRRVVILPGEARDDT